MIRYLCQCGLEFGAELGKYGCPGDCGGVARLKAGGTGRWHPEGETMSKFEAGKTYEGRMICNSDLIERITVARRTEKTVTTTEGKRLKIHVSNDGTEFVYPDGRYSMATIIRAREAA